MEIAVIGAGYVGLTTGACFADMGHHVLDWRRLRRTVERPVIFDGRNMLSGEAVISKGFECVGIGFPTDSMQMGRSRLSESHAQEAVHCIG